jgi:hypothetical protein
MLRCLPLPEVRKMAVNSNEGEVRAVQAMSHCMALGKREKEALYEEE